VSAPGYLDIDALRQLRDIIMGNIPQAYAQGTPGVAGQDLAEAYGAERWFREQALQDLHRDLDQVGRKFRLRAGLDSHAASTADIETLGTVEFHFGKGIEALRLTATDAEGRATAQRLFRMLLPHAQEAERVEDVLQAVQSLHGWAKDCRRRPISRPGRPGEEAKTWLVGELARLFDERLGFLEASLEPQEFAERRNLFVVRATELLGVPMSRDAIKKRRQRTGPS
jgi:hypothetical protein